MREMKVKECKRSFLGKETLQKGLVLKLNRPLEKAGVTGSKPEPQDPANLGELGSAL